MQQRGWSLWHLITEATTSTALICISLITPLNNCKNYARVNVWATTNRWSDFWFLNVITRSAPRLEILNSWHFYFSWIWLVLLFFFFFFFLTSLEFHTVMENIPSCASGVVAGFHRLALIWQPVSVDVTSSLGSAAWIYTYPLILPWREDDTWSLHYCAGGERERCINHTPTDSHASLHL